MAIPLGTSGIIMHIDVGGGGGLLQLEAKSRRGKPGHKKAPYMQLRHVFFRAQSTPAAALSRVAAGRIIITSGSSRSQPRDR